ncbi:UDP-glucose/GDP-mannose dehydrogenase family protein [Patescibacteria group bacterium]|nr:MAG: UDP-glucose/GDP-mannose dehydrogenase family protein [Patescibacteria group bacterium]
MTLMCQFDSRRVHHPSLCGASAGEPKGSGPDRQSRPNRAALPFGPHLLISPRMNLVVVGCGYVGLANALGFAKLGHRVACVDADAGKVAKLDVGRMPFFEPGMPELLRSMQEAGRVVFTGDLGSVINGAEAALLCVGTPPSEDGAPDLSFVHAAADDIAKHLSHPLLLIVKSTVPCGTAAALRERFERAGKGDLVRLASVPEFLREGQALKDFFQPDRVVIGSDDGETRALVDSLHAGIEAPRLIMSHESAELAKYAANAFLATKVSFINEMANLCERTGADVRDVEDVLGSDPRIGADFLRPGIGYGGSCFPKDVGALHRMAGANGYDFRLLSAAIDVNNRQRERFVERLERTLGGVKGRRLAVWGLAFKGGTGDARASAAVDVVRALHGRGAEIVAYDPQATSAAADALPDGIIMAPTAVDACDGAEALVVLTDWAEFRDVSFDAVRERLLGPCVFDGRNLLADLGLPKKGFTYYGVGIQA